VNASRASCRACPSRWARHFTLYLDFAGRHAATHGLDLDGRLSVLADVEAELATAPDTEFRFHSGPVANG